METADLTPLRTLSETDVREALKDAYVALPLTTEADVVEAMLRIVEMF